ncbi:hypothetical protein ACTJKE_24160 [Ensifer sp. 22521]|uniref:hypothetical protein n=1 Tax=Ensifer sp. 22521 TaxID=3453935 RepID=UPI003F841EFD
MHRGKGTFPFNTGLAAINAVLGRSAIVWGALDTYAMELWMAIDENRDVRTDLNVSLRGA